MYILHIYKIYTGLKHRIPGLEKLALMFNINISVLCFLFIVHYFTLKNSVDLNLSSPKSETLTTQVCVTKN